MFGNSRKTRHSQIAEAITRPAVATPKDCEAEVRFTLTAGSPDAYYLEQDLSIRMVCAGLAKGKPFVVERASIRDENVTQAYIDQKASQAELDVRSRCVTCPLGPFVAAPELRMINGGATTAADGGVDV